MDMHCSMVIEGWDEECQFYVLEGYHDIIFHYVGENYFHITIFKGKESEHTTITYNHLVHFTITMSAYQFTASHFGNFLTNFWFSYY